MQATSRLYNKIMPVEDVTDSISTKELKVTEQAFIHLAVKYLTKQISSDLEATRLGLFNCFEIWQALGSSEAPDKFQSNTIISKLILIASRFHEI